MTETDSDFINNFFEEKNIKNRTKANYRCAIKSYEKFHGMTLEELLQEAINEEKKPKRERKLKKRLSDYRKWSINSHLSTKTAKNYFTKIKTLYKAFDCDIPELIKIKYNDDEKINYYDIPNKKHIKQAINIVEGGIRSVILFMASSGTGKTEVSLLTVYDFLKACNDFHSFDIEDKNLNIISVLNELNEYIGDIVPLFYLKRIKTGRYYHTCCSNEATRSIINSLLSRKDLKINSSLFNYSVRQISDKLKEANDRMNWGKVGKYRFFRSHSLRKFHASNIQLDEKYIHELQGRAPNPLSATYIKIDPELLREKYIEHMDDVTIQDIKPIVNNEEYHIHINIMLMGSDYGINI